MMTDFAGAATRLDQVGGGHGLSARGFEPLLHCGCGNAIDVIAAAIDLRDS